LDLNQDEFFQIRIPKSAIANSPEWLTRPGSQQLGAKWVEVNGWSARQAEPAKRANLKRGQQHPLRESLRKRFGQHRILSDLLPAI